MSCAAASQQSFHIGLIIPVHPSVKNSKSEVSSTHKRRDISPQMYSHYDNKYICGIFSTPAAAAAVPSPVAIAA